MDKSNNTNPIDKKDVAQALYHILAAVDELRSETTKSISDISRKHGDDYAKLDKKITENVKGSTTIIKKIAAPVVEKIYEQTEQYELTDYDKEEIIAELKKKLPKDKYEELEDDIKTLRKEIVRLQTAISFSSMGNVDIQVPFETIIKAGTNVTVTKDVSGAYVISATGGSSSSFYGPIALTGAKNGTNKVFVLATAITPSSLDFEINGTELQQGVDYTIGGDNKTITLASYAPISTDWLIARAATGPVSGNNTYPNFIGTTYTAAISMAVGSVPFRILVPNSSQNGGQSTEYVYDGINTGILLWTVSTPVDITNA